MNLLTAQAKDLRLSATLEINELVQSQLANGKEVVHLGFGEATFPIHENVLEAHSGASRNTSYLPVAGLMKLREVSPSPHFVRRNEPNRHQRWSTIACRLCADKPSQSPGSNHAA
jgi:aspartate/methionine/tyrosine aminotransferase